MLALTPGVGLERLDRRLGEERQEGQLDALARLEVGLGRWPQPRDPGQVDLDHGGELRGDLQRLDHPARRSPCAAGTSSRWCRAAVTAAAAAAAVAGSCAGSRAAAACCAGCRALAAAAASSTSCLRIRPPTPVPRRPARSTPCSAASLRTSGVTYGAPVARRLAGARAGACGGGGRLRRRGSWRCGGCCGARCLLRRGAGGGAGAAARLLLLGGLLALVLLGLPSCGLPAVGLLSLPAAGRLPPSGCR